MTVKQRRSGRALSHTEMQAAFTCQAQWDFGYGGHLAGGATLKPRILAPILSNGRAWGRAVAAWHAFPATDTLLSVYHPGQAAFAAHRALRASYAHDLKEQIELGASIAVETLVEQQSNVAEILDHYMAIAKPMRNLSLLEEELYVAIPSRSGKHVSSRYRFEGYIDGYYVDDNGDEWIVEFKLRDSLTAVAQIGLDRQIRRYAWARQRQTGRHVAGVIVDERLSYPPVAPKIVKAKRKSEGIDGLTPSHDVDQRVRVQDYVALCERFDVEPRPNVIEALSTRRWQQRVPILFRKGELEEAGRELVSAAKLIRDLDSGEMWPVRNSQPRLCGGCRYKSICANPTDTMFVDMHFARTVPKRLRALDEDDAAKAPEPERSEPSSSPIASSDASPFENAVRVHRLNRERERESAVVFS